MLSMSECFRLRVYQLLRIMEQLSSFLPTPVTNRFVTPATYTFGRHVDNDAGHLAENIYGAARALGVAHSVLGD